MIAPKPTIHPDGLYTVDETAEILGFRGENPKARQNAVYRIPYEDLPRTAVGPRRGKKLFRGRHILQYMDACTQERTP